ncbi:hypothetical protein EDD18DRAFT_1112208 [Armillaria luteobubalina]|uniref:Uncharacterized protein n=1 Tax=Armillaria luteobubalina TaxID=153913 RepID=A0AA39PFE6_9AGAR|nr:hypothetical protein EDD18DRAFT_1112208 [Armillaria luteobubalina]
MSSEPPPRQPYCNESRQGELELPGSSSSMAWKEITPGSPSYLSAHSTDAILYDIRPRGTTLNALHDESLLPSPILRPHAFTLLFTNLAPVVIFVAMVPSVVVTRTPAAAASSRRHLSLPPIAVIGDKVQDLRGEVVRDIFVLAPDEFSSRLQSAPSASRSPMPNMFPVFASGPGGLWDGGLVGHVHVKQVLQRAPPTPCSTAATAGIFPSDHLVWKPYEASSSSSLDRGVHSWRGGGRIGDLGGDAGEGRARGVRAEDVEGHVAVMWCQKCSRSNASVGKHLHLNCMLTTGKPPPFGFCERVQSTQLSSDVTRLILGARLGRGTRPEVGVEGTYRLGHFRKSTWGNALSHDSESYKGTLTRQTHSGPGRSLLGLCAGTTTTTIWRANVRETIVYILLYTTITGDDVVKIVCDWASMLAFDTFIHFGPLPETCGSQPGRIIGPLGHLHVEVALQRYH